MKLIVSRDGTVLDANDCIMVDISERLHKLLMEQPDSEKQAFAATYNALWHN
jgi:hypothetical protein